MVAFAGAGPCPHRTVGRPLSAGAKMIGTSPPGPLRCGSTTCRTNPVATAASKALPPPSSTAMPAAEASQCVEATMPNVPAKLRVGSWVHRAVALGPLSHRCDAPAVAG